MRRVVEIARAALAAATRVAIRLSARRVGLVLVYHAVAEHSGDPRHELVPAHGRAVFEAHLRHLRSRYRVVEVGEIHEAVARRRRGGRFPVAITFDDDLASHVREAAPTLSRLGLPAAFFIGGSSLDGPFAYWWQHLQRAVDTGLAPWSAGDVHEQAGWIEGMSRRDRAVEAQRLAAALEDGPHDPGLRPDDVRGLADAGFRVGFHTLCHDRLTDLDDIDLRAALVDGRARLEGVLGHQVTTVAYPHGKADARVAAAARAVGYDLGLTGRYGPVAPGSDPLLVSRIEPAFGPPGAFMLQLARALLIRPHR